MFRSRPAPLQGGFSNLRYVVQRLSAVGLLLFLGAHLYLAWFEPRFLHGRPEPFAQNLARDAVPWPDPDRLRPGRAGDRISPRQRPLELHDHGLGVTVSKSGIKWMERVSILVFLVLLAIGFAAVYALYRGGEAYGVA